MGENRAAVSVAVFSRFAIYANIVRRTKRGREAMARTIAERRSVNWSR